MGIRVVNELERERGITILDKKVRGGKCAPEESQLLFRACVQLKDRLCQEAVLGVGGVRLLRGLGHRKISRFHMNERHAALLTVALLEEIVGRPNLAYTGPSRLRPVPA